MAVTPLTRSQSAPPVFDAAPASRHAVGANAPVGDRIDRSPAPAKPADLPRHGLGIGLLAGASAEAGIGVGAGATVAAGAGLFYDSRHGVAPGTFASAGAFAGAGTHARTFPNSPSPVGAVGAYAGAGVGAFVTNAASVNQLAGIAQTYSANVGVGPVKVSLQVGVANGTYLGSVSFGPGIGVDASCYPTQSVARSK